VGRESEKVVKRASPGSVMKVVGLESALGGNGGAELGQGDLTVGRIVDVIGGGRKGNPVGVAIGLHFAYNEFERP